MKNLNTIINEAIKTTLLENGWEVSKFRGIANGAELTADSLYKGQKQVNFMGNSISLFDHSMKPAHRCSIPLKEWDEYPLLSYFIMG
jgi:hypothetical protein